VRVQPHLRRKSEVSRRVGWLSAASNREPHRLDVVVVAGDRDVHANVVEGELRRLGANFKRVDIPSLHRVRLTARPGSFLTIDAERVDAGSTVWWRRPGSFDTGGMAADEALLAEAEAWSIFQGSIRSSGARVVDPPWVMHQAEDKIYQLQLAKSLGLAIPETVVTNVTTTAAAFLKSGPTVAKSTSSGPGLAPFVDEVTTDLVDLVTRLPVLLQHAIPADADLRVVTIGDSALVWRRERRADDPWDWRAIDPSGRDFRLMNGVDIDRPASRLARELGLTFSVQDWLDVQSGPVFLEVNPQGQWLFLEGATEAIAPLMARHLFSR
jgi:glutathione synthase/RimK-type ligase-like ATP-grasp enzyme